ncbi:MAG TPA: TA system VapC family ribonuclease toxin [Candidatus Acidoferrales bacterium]|nr:TA system VapC family ribonuclease toxin [Candidatus Acidoferrales bacterium]
MIFPDVNVWVALAYDKHSHHSAAHRWFDSLNLEDPLCFCRFTQIGFLRLLSTEAVMGIDGVLSQSEAWREYDRWFKEGRVEFLDEPDGLELRFRSLSDNDRPSRKDWADAYLTAFAAAGGLHLVTFDRGFRNRLRDVVILES